MFHYDHHAQTPGSSGVIRPCGNPQKRKDVYKRQLLHMTKTIVVLDHHRRGSEVIENAVLSYVEPYASSACAVSYTHLDVYKRQACLEAVHERLQEESRDRV